MLENEETAEFKLLLELQEVSVFVLNPTLCLELIITEEITASASPFLSQKPQ